MNTKKLIFLVCFVSLFPFLAQAQTAGADQESKWINLFWGLLPFLLIAFTFFWYFKRVQSSKNPRVRKYDEYVARQVQHMERMEQYLERIAQSLEKKD